MIKYEFTPQEVKELKETFTARVEFCEKELKRHTGVTMKTYWKDQRDKAQMVLDKIKYGQIE